MKRIEQRTFNNIKNCINYITLVKIEANIKQENKQYI